MAGYTELEREFNNEFGIQVSGFFASNQNNNPEYIQGKIEEIKANIVRNIRIKYMRKLSDITQRNVIVYYSTWLHGASQGEVNPELMINDNDINGFMNAIVKLDKEKGLDLILHTPGGITTATEAIVKYLRKIFNGNIRVIVPHMAMSAGTMIACSANEIIMGKQSSLGPIDPQYRGVPAEGVVSEFDRAIKETNANPNTILIWREIISKYMPTFVGECNNVIELSKSLLKQWLESGMFKNSRKKDIKIEKILNELASHSASKVHDKHYDYNDCKKLGLKVVKLEDDQDLQDAVLTVHHSYVLSSYVLPMSIKYIENNEGQQFIISGRR